MTRRFLATVAAVCVTLGLSQSAFAVSPQPGDTCTGLTGQYTTNSGALQIPGLFLVCDGSHWNLFESFTTGGNVGIGTTSPGAPLAVFSATGNEASFISTGSHNGNTTIDNAAGGNQSTIDFNDAGSTKWQIGKQTDNTFFFYDVSTGKNAILIGATAAGLVMLGENGQLSLPSSGNVGIGTTSPQATLDVTGTLYSRRVTLTDAATIAVDWSQGNIQSVTLGGNRTFTFANPVDGARYILIIKQDATGSRTATWPATVRWPGGTAPTLTTTASKTDYITFIYNGVDSKYDGVALSQNF